MRWNSEAHCATPAPRYIENADIPADDGISAWGRISEAPPSPPRPAACEALSTAAPATPELRRGWRESPRSASHLCTVWTDGFGPDAHVDPASSCEHPPSLPPSSPLREVPYAETFAWRGMHSPYHNDKHKASPRPPRPLGHA